MLPFLMGIFSLPTQTNSSFFTSTNPGQPPASTHLPAECLVSEISCSNRPFPAPLWYWVKPAARSQTQPDLTQAVPTVAAPFSFSFFLPGRKGRQAELTFGCEQATVLCYGRAGGASRGNVPIQDAEFGLEMLPNGHF